jgi:predicted metal-dependent HD superfamily phosphohydrolase
VLGVAGVNADTIAEVKRLILATKTHKADDDDTDCKILLDADLSVLGSSPELYDLYSAAIRKEYHWVTEADYRTGRKLVLENFLKRERIYYTEYMHQKYEVLARENITREIIVLSQEIDNTNAGI